MKFGTKQDIYYTKSNVLLEGKSLEHLRKADHKIIVKYCNDLNDNKLTDRPELEVSINSVAEIEIAPIEMQEVKEIKTGKLFNDGMKIR